MKKVLFGLILATSLLFGGIKKTDIDYSAFDKIPSKDLASMMATEMTKSMQLPMQIDYLTRLLNIYSYDTTMYFRKEVDIEHKNIAEIWKTNKDGLIQAMFKIDSQNVCNNPTWKYMIFKRNIIPEFNYIDKEKKPLFRYTIEQEDCNKLN